MRRAMKTLQERKKHETASYDVVAATYDARLASHTARFAGDLIDLLYPQAEDHGLDLGGGTGAAGIKLAERIGPRGSVTIVDASAGMLSVAAANAAGRDLANVETRVMDAERLEFPDSSFDLAVCSFAAAYFIDIERAVSEALRVLKPGGRIGFASWSLPDRFPFYSATAIAFMQQSGPWHVRAAINLPLLSRRIRNRILMKRGPNGFSPCRFAGDGKLERILTRGGFTSIRREMRAYPMEYATFDELWDALESGTTAGLRFRNYTTSVVSNVRSSLRRQFVNPRTNEVLLFNEASLILAKKPR